MGPHRGARAAGGAPDLAGEPGREGQGVRVGQLAEAAHPLALVHPISRRVERGAARGETRPGAAPAVQEELVGGGEWAGRRLVGEGDWPGRRPGRAQARRRRGAGHQGRSQ